MTVYRVDVQVNLRDGLLDPQGHTVQSALAALGFDGLEDVRIGKWVRLRVRAESRDEAARRVREMCERLLANPVTEDFEIRAIEPVKEAPARRASGRA
ncbi:MAG: phosphoribosylformylglycinamidine synthase subunit PurS [Gemmatimonadota bacterium]